MIWYDMPISMHRMKLYDGLTPQKLKRKCVTQNQCEGFLRRKSHSQRARLGVRPSFPELCLEGSMLNNGHFCNMKPLLNFVCCAMMCIEQRV
jgi:hypothetical protein